MATRVFGDSSFVEFKIYISLKPSTLLYPTLGSFVEFKIYISLKQINLFIFVFFSFVEFKIYISLKPQIEIWRKKF